MVFEESVKRWVGVDNKIRELNEHVRSLREEKNQLTENLIVYASEQNITHKTIEITDGTLKFQNRKETSPLTFKFIESCLTDCISDGDQVKQLIDYIKKKREVKYVGEVKRNYK